MYHRFGQSGEARRTDVRTFTQQMEILRRHFLPRPLSEVVSRLESGESLEPNTVVVTVDDGYSDFAEYAVPVLMRFMIPATVYVVSDFVSQKTWLWFDALRWIIENATPDIYQITLTTGPHIAHLGLDSDRHQLWQLVAGDCLGLAPAEQCAAVERLQRELLVTLPERPSPNYAGMTWEQVRSLDPRLIEVGAHTSTHAILSRCSPALQRKEIGECRRAIEENTGRAAHAFCYPNGMPGDFDDTTVEIVRELGFTSAVMAHGGLCHRSSDRFRLQRLVAPDDVRMFENAVNGLWHLRDAAGPGSRR